MKDKKEGRKKKRIRKCKNSGWERKEERTRRKINDRRNKGKRRGEEDSW